MSDELAMRVMDLRCIHQASTAGWIITVCQRAADDIESLQAENARLTSEVARLREENESFWKIYPDLRMYMNACVLDADWTAWDEDVRQRLMAIGLRKLETLAKP